VRLARTAPHQPRSNATERGVTRPGILLPLNCHGRTNFARTPAALAARSFDRRRTDPTRRSPQAVHDLSELPDAAASTINFGIPTFSGQIVGKIDRRRLEDGIRQCIVQFEPRLIPSTLKVHVALDTGAMSNKALRFEIEADMWAEPVPLQLLVNAVVDLETGASTVESV
jgi:predicted component of type VI protein secretion system